jgi:muramoyltetrapeptide carboxypeptidase
MLTHLLLSRRLNGITGLIAGEFVGCGEPDSINRILKDTFTDMGIPVISQIPLGHGTENITLPVGLWAQVDSETMTLSLLEPCFTS